MVEDRSIIEAKFIEISNNFRVVNIVSFYVDSLDKMFFVSFSSNINRVSNHQCWSVVNRLIIRNKRILENVIEILFTHFSFPISSQTSSLSRNICLVCCSVSKHVRTPPIDSKFPFLRPTRLVPSRQLGEKIILKLNWQLNDYYGWSGKLSQPLCVSVSTERGLMLLYEFPIATGSFL